MLPGLLFFYHCNGIKVGVDALKIAVGAVYREIVEKNKLKKYAKSIGKKGRPLLKGIVRNLLIR